MFLHNNNNVMPHTQQLHDWLTSTTLLLKIIHDFHREHPFNRTTYSLLQENLYQAQSQKEQICSSWKAFDPRVIPTSKDFYPQMALDPRRNDRIHRIRANIFICAGLRAVLLICSYDSTLPAIYDILLFIQNHYDAVRKIMKSFAHCRAPKLNMAGEVVQYLSILRSTLILFAVDSSLSFVPSSSSISLIARRKCLPQGHCQ